jgi:hypothetical protein
MDSATIILFAIRSVIRLGQQARVAYIDAIRRKKLVLPISNFFSNTNPNDAINYFKDPNFGKKYVDGISDDSAGYDDSKSLQKLLAKSPSKLTNKEKKYLVTLHEKYVNLERSREGSLAWESGEYPVEQDLEALFTIRQWRIGADPFPSTLQRIAGSLVEIGIDYARIAPDLFDKNSKKGKAIVGFLNALDEINLPEIEISELPPRLFVATMESASEIPELFSGDIKIQEFIKATTKALSTDAAARIKEINKDPSLDAIAKRKARLKVQDWGELIYRSTLASGGRLILSNPARYLGVEEAEQQALISAVGGSVLDLVLADDGGLEAVFSREGLELVIKAALEIVGEYPEILSHSKNKAINKLLAELATEFSKTTDLIAAGILPEIARMILEKSGENLDLFWPDLKNKPEKNLVLTAAKTTLAIISRPPKGSETWKIRFARKDLLAVTETVLNELVTNPGWLITEAGELSGTLKDVLEAMISLLRQHGGKRLNPAVGREIIQVAIEVIVFRQEFITKLPNGRPVVAAAVEAVVGTLFDKNLAYTAAWQLLRTEMVTGIVRLALEKLALSGLDQEAIGKLQECLDKHLLAITQGEVFNLKSLADCLDKKLSLIP